MTVRNFYATIRNHGTTSAKPIATGPKGKQEGFTVTIEQRDRGEIAPALEIQGRVIDNGDGLDNASLKLTVFNAQGHVIHTFTTTR